MSIIITQCPQKMTLNFKIKVGGGGAGIKVLKETIAVLSPFGGGEGVDELSKRGFTRGDIIELIAISWKKKSKNNNNNSYTLGRMKN